MKFTTLVAATLTVAFTHSAHALPLLSESAALNVGSALTLYPDHLDQSKFYFMPNSSRIGRDSRGVPTFSFTYYGLTNNEPDAGALMVYVGRLTSEREQKEALDAFLKANPGKGIAVLPIKESTVTLNSTQPTALAPFFTEFNFSQKGGRAEDEIGVNAVLTKVGAKVLKASLLNESGAALKYDMCYKVQGLGPAMDAHIYIKMNRVYEHFKATASGGALWWRASIATEIEKLHKLKVVDWTINGGDAKDEDYVREVTNQILEKMFTPELTMSPSGNQSIWDRSTPFSFGASYTKKEENDLVDYSIKKRALETREFCLPLTISDIHGHTNKCVIDADKF